MKYAIKKILSQPPVGFIKHSQSLFYSAMIFSILLAHTHKLMLATNYTLLDFYEFVTWYTWSRVGIPPTWRCELSSGSRDYSHMEELFPLPPIHVSSPWLPSLSWELLPKSMYESSLRLPSPPFAPCLSEWIYVHESPTLTHMSISS